MNESINQFETRQVQLIFPETTNHYSTLHGGKALLWMDEVAFITATRFSRQHFVTVGLDKTEFRHPIPAGSIVELIGKVTHVGNSSLKITVSIFIEDMYSTQRKMAVEGNFTFVAVDSNGKPTKIMHLPS